MSTKNCTQKTTSIAKKLKMGSSDPADILVFKEYLISAIKECVTSDDCKEDKFSCDRRIFLEDQLMKIEDRRLTTVPFIIFD